MTNKLLQHMARMQERAAKYIEPSDYTNLDGKTVSTETVNGVALHSVARDSLFIHDLIYLLDGPEQREAQAEASFDFVAESMVTASNKFHGEKVEIGELLQALTDFSAAAGRLDRMKKALFYGRDYIANPSRPQPSRPDEDHCAYPIIERIAEQLSGDNEDAGWIADQIELAFHSIIGIATESGEMVDAWLSAYKHGKALDLVNLREELGDNQWYVAIGIKATAALLGQQTADFDTLHRNINRKLRARFPAGFTEYDANNRDLVKERAILEGDTFDAEQVAAGSQMRGQPVEPPFACKPLEFPDEPHSGVDLAPGKLSDKS